MIINFKGVSNRDYMMLVAVIFELPDGEIVSVGCDSYSFYSEFVTSEEDKEEGWLVEFEMEWRVCFIWDTSNEEMYKVQRYFVQGEEEILRQSEIIGFITDHDAIDEYEVAFDWFEVY